MAQHSMEHSGIVQRRNHSSVTLVNSENGMVKHNHVWQTSAVMHRVMQQRGIVWSYPRRHAFLFRMHHLLVGSKVYTIPYVGKRTKRPGPKSGMRSVYMESVLVLPTICGWLRGLRFTRRSPRSLLVSGTADTRFSWYLRSKVLLACRDYLHGVPSAVRAHE